MFHGRQEVPGIVPRPCPLAGLSRHVVPALEELLDVCVRFAVLPLRPRLLPYLSLSRQPPSRKASEASVSCAGSDSVTFLILEEIDITLISPTVTN